MASAPVTLGDSGAEFEVDTTEQTATLNTPGGYLRNMHATVAAYVNVVGGAVTTAQPAGQGHGEIKPGEVYPLPKRCSLFKFKATAQTFLQYTREQPK